MYKNQSSFLLKYTSVINYLLFWDGQDVYDEKDENKEEDDE